MSGTPAPSHINPVLVEGLDQVLLIRLYPDAAGLTDAGAKAVAQGDATGVAGETLEGSQYEPVLGAPEPPPPPPPQRSGPGPQREA